MSGCILFLHLTSVARTSSTIFTVIPWKKTAAKFTIRSNIETSIPGNGLHKTSGKGPIGKMYIFLCVDRFFWYLFKFLKQVWTFHWGYVCISRRSRGSPVNSSNKFSLEAVGDVANWNKRRVPWLKRSIFPIRALLLIVFDDGLFILTKQVWYNFQDFDPAMLLFWNRPYGPQSFSTSQFCAGKSRWRHRESTRERCKLFWMTFLKKIKNKCRMKTTGNQNLIKLRVYFSTWEGCAHRPGY